MPPAKKMTARHATKTTRGAKRAARASGPRKASGARTLSAAHKRALADGRAMSAVVDQYLAAVNTPKRRGRKVSEATLRERLAGAQARLKTSKGVDKVLAAQEVRDLRDRLARLSAGSGVDVKSLEDAFVKIAKSFGERRGLGYAAWRDAGVPADVLRRAGVARTRG